MQQQELSLRHEFLLVTLAAFSLNLALFIERLGVFSIVYLACMFTLAWTGSARRAFYFGLGIGTFNAMIQLWFFADLFKTGAPALWMILGLWVGLYLLTAHKTVHLFPTWGSFLLPFIWLGFEYFRSELYPLRFSWVTPGMALNHPDWLPLAGAGFYGISFLAMATFAVLRHFHLRQRVIWASVLSIVSILAIGAVRSQPSQPPTGPKVAGIQYEFAYPSILVKGLDKLLRKHPEAELVVLSEYSFQGPVPPEIANWCRSNQRYLIAGGKESTGPGLNDFRNTAYVIDPTGQVVHQQVKTVPIQFFHDGSPATSQKVWDSPWGPIGIAICYDMSYSRVIDELVRQGAQALIIPTLDAEHWGKRQHELHAKMAPIRARECNIPILRVASSGISQLVTANGIVTDSAPFPGQGETIAGTLEMSSHARIPLDRTLALPATFIAAFLLLVGLVMKRPHASSATPKPSRQRIPSQEV